MTLRTITVLLALAPLACDYGPRGEYLPEGGVALGESESHGAAEDEDEDEDEIDEMPEAPSLDLGSPTEISCTKIDFLFVIDDSGSMGDEQERLIDGFPGFIAGVEDAIAQYDYHMMVVTTGFAQLPGEQESCETAIGSGRVTAADGDACGVGSADVERRYATADEDGLSDVFSCVADVGITGWGDERPVWSMAQALTTHALPGGCNEGFLRDDAILVVTIITDEEDDAGADSPGDPAVWKEVVLAAKHGDEKSVVMLGLLGDTDLEDGACEPFDATGDGAEGAPRLREFVESFEYGSWSSVCADDYTPFFTSAIDDIGQACIDFQAVP